MDFGDVAVANDYGFSPQVPSQLRRDEWVDAPEVMNRGIYSYYSDMYAFVNSAAFLITAKKKSAFI
jgi:hypothetical protein